MCKKEKKILVGVNSKSGCWQTHKDSDSEDDEDDIYADVYDALASNVTHISIASAPVTPATPLPPPGPAGGEARQEEGAGGVGGYLNRPLVTGAATVDNGSLFRPGAGTAGRNCVGALHRTVGERRVYTCILHSHVHMCYTHWHK